MKEIVEKALKIFKKNKIQEGEVYAEDSSRLEVEIRGGKVESYKERNARALAIRVLLKGRIGFSYSSSLEDSDIETVISKACMTAKYSQPEPNLELAPGNLKYPKVKSFSKEVAEYPSKKLIDDAIKMEDAARSFDERIVKFRKTRTTRSIGSLFLANTLGLSQDRKYSALVGVVSPVAAENNEQQIGWEMVFARDADKFDTIKTGIDAARNAVEKLGAKSFPTGRYSVVLKPEVTSEIVDALMSAFYGEQILKGKSLFASSLGKQIAATSVTLVDDALMEEGCQKTPFDDEGTPCGKTEIVAGGYLKSFLNNRYSAKTLHMSPTGNGFKAGLEATPKTAYTNLYLKTTGETAEQVLGASSECLLVSDAMNLHSIDPISGDFSIGVTGHYVKNGQKQYPVKGLAIAGNVRGLLTSFRMIGSDVRYFAGAPAGSHVLLEDISVSGSKS